MSRAAPDEIDRIIAQAQHVARGTVTARRAKRGFYDRARRQRGHWVMSLNLTPMIDTVFNLLFFFMVVSRFGAIEGLLAARLPVRTLEASVPGAVTAVPRTPLRIRIEMDAVDDRTCRYRIDKLAEAPAPMRELPQRLASIREKEPGFDTDTPVYLYADDSILWDHVVNAYNAAMSAGYDKIYFAGAR